MKLNNKFAIGCLAQWYEIEIFEEYIESVMKSLMDIDNKKQGYTVSATADLEKNKRCYDLPEKVMSIERVEILDSNDRYIMIPKLTDPHKLLRADTDASNDELK